MYSVIIPSLGKLAYLNELIGSILVQTAPVSEILILLDKNEHCHSIAPQVREHSAINIIFCTKMNLSEKRNFGASIAKHEYIIFSDDDDIWNAHRAEEVVLALGDYPACCHNYDKFGSSNANNLSKLGMNNKVLTVLDLLRGANVFGGGSSIAAKRALVQLFPFSPTFHYCEDFEWWSRILSSSIQVKYLGTSLVSYRTHANNMTGAVLKIIFYNLLVARRIGLLSLYLSVSSLMILLKSLFQFFKLLVRSK